MAEIPTLAPRAPEPNLTEGIPGPQQKFNVRVRKALDVLTDVLNSLLRSGEITREGSGWTIFGSAGADEFAAALEALAAALVAEVAAEVSLLQSYFRALLRAWVLMMGFPVPPGIPQPEVSAALSGG